MSLTTKSGYIGYEPDLPRRHETRVVHVLSNGFPARDSTHAQCTRCGVMFPTEHRPYCLFNWRDAPRRE